MTINLYDVLSVEGKTKDYEAVFEEMQQTFQGEALTIVQKAPFVITIHHVSKDVITIKSELTLKVTRMCARCLEETLCEYDLSIDEKVDVAKKIVFDDSDDNSKEDNEYDEVSYIEDCTLDVARLILDELYTILPMSVLCKENCKGICKVCGTNLNKSSCDCDQTVPDPRMAVFGDIFKQFNASNGADEK